MRLQQLSIGVLLCLAICSSAQTPAVPTDWQTSTTLPGIDLTSLTALQKPVVLGILRETPCTCGCGMKLAECRVKDPVCSYSKALAKLAIQSVSAGKSKVEVAKILANSKIAPPPPPPLLEEAVKIGIDGAPYKGPANAKITIVEFSDFQCPYCSLAVLKANQLLQMYPNDVKLVFKHFPLDMHPQARLAAEASMAANAQGKFWPMHDKLFANFRQLSHDHMIAWAKEIGLDVPRFTSDLDSGKYKKAVEKDLAEAENLGVSATPTFYINGQKFNSAPEPENLKPVIDAELKK